MSPSKGCSRRIAGGSWVITLTKQPKVMKLATASGNFDWDRSRVGTRLLLVRDAIHDVSNKKVESRQRDGIAIVSSHKIILPT